MTEACKTTVEICEKAAKELALPMLKTIADEYRTMLESERPTLTIVDLSGLSEELAVAVEKICGEPIFKNYMPQLRKWSSWRIRLEYGDAYAVYSNEISPECRISENLLEEQDPDSLILTVPSEPLKEKTIALLNAGKKESACTREILASERIMLLTNADMAMTQLQKDWISEFIQDSYDYDRTSVCIIGMDKLEDDAQEVQVTDYVNRIVNTLSEDITVCTENSMRDYIFADSSDVLSARSEKCLCKNMIKETDALLRYELEKCKTEENDYIQAEKELDQYSGQLLRAGELTAKNVLGNEIKEMIDSVSKSAEEYSDAMSESIRHTIESAKDIEDVENRIKPYMERSWEYFAEQTSVQLSKDFDVLNRKITRRMEDDIEDMVKNMNIQTQTVLEYSLNSGDMEFISEIHFAQASDEALKSVSRNARNLMILSIPLLFVSPMLTVATLLGSGVYSGIGKKQEGEKYRQELAENVQRACDKARKAAVEEFANTLQDENVKMEELIMQGYQNLLDLWKEDIGKQKLNLEGAKTRAGEIALLQDKLASIAAKL